MVKNNIKKNYEISDADGKGGGFGGEAWFNLKMTNTLESGTYTVVFEIFPTLFEKGTVRGRTLASFDPLTINQTKAATEKCFNKQKLQASNFSLLFFNT